ncbi:unnamed protein product [Schistosoma intercalatum]|nr:unnamed protein product [Schistosoma intercalatum]
MLYLTLVVAFKLLRVGISTVAYYPAEINFTLLGFTLSITQYTNFQHTPSQTEPNISNFDKFLDETLDRISTVPLDILYEKYFKYSRLEGNQSVTTDEIQYNETTSRTFNFPSSSGNHLKDISNGYNRKNNKKRSFKISRSLVIGDADSTHCPRINIIEKQDLPGYPDWPGMVCYNSEGRYAEFDASSREVTYYYVVFLNSKRLAMSKVPANRIHKFTTFNEVDLSKIPKRFWRRLQAAGQEAENALLLSVKNRIAIYGYHHKYEDIPVKVSIENLEALDGRFVFISSQVKNSSRLYQEKSQTISNEIKRKRVYKRKIPPIHSCSINENSNRLTDYQLDTNSNYTSHMIPSSEEKLSNAIINGNTNVHKVMPVSNHISDNYNKESNNISLNNNSIEYQQLDLSLKSNVLAKSNNKTFDTQYNNTDINIDNDVLLNDNTCQKMIMNDKISSIDCYSPSFLKPIECDQIMKEFICSIDNCSNLNIETTNIQMNNTIYLEQNNLSLDNYENNKPKSNLIRNQNYFKLTYNDLLVYSNNVIANINDIPMSPDYSNKDTVQHLSLNSSKKILYENIPFYYQYFGSNEA